MARLVFAITCILLLAAKAEAGWYRIENYQGFIGEDPVHFSIQRYEFGSGITVEGSYFRDETASPVAIYGKDKGAKLELCEISDDKAFHSIIIMGSKTPVDTTGCPFSLDVGESGLTGIWNKDGEEFPVVLRKVAALDDTGEGKIEGTVAIPFWTQTAAHMFSGLYANTSDGICLEKLEVIDKASKKVDQEIRFGGDCNAGMLMTPIYMNVEKQAEGTDAIFVNFRDNSAGYTMDYAYDPTAGKYVQQK